MTALKLSLALSLLASLTLPAAAKAEANIIINKPYYNNGFYHRWNNNDRFSNHTKRRHFDNRYQPDNPALNRNFSILDNNAQRRLLVRPSYSNRINIRQRQFAPNPLFESYRQGYQRGYRHGYSDAISTQRRSYRLGQ